MQFSSVQNNFYINNLFTYLIILNFVVVFKYFLQYLDYFLYYLQATNIGILGCIILINIYPKKHIYDKRKSMSRKSCESEVII